MGLYNLNYQYYKLPENQFGFSQVRIACNNIRLLKFYGDPQNNLIARKIDINGIRKEIVDWKDTRVLSETHNISFMLDSEENLERVGMYLENCKDKIDYYKFPENNLGFVNLGVGKFGAELVLNHRSGSYVIIEEYTIKIRRWTNQADPSLKI